MAASESREQRLTVSVLEVAPKAFCFISSYQKSERNSKYFFPFHYGKNVLEAKLKVLSTSLRNISCVMSHLTHFQLVFYTSIPPENMRKHRFYFCASKLIFIPHKIISREKKLID